MSATPIRELFRMPRIKYSCGRFRVAGARSAKARDSCAGFTLVEMLVSIALFSVIMVTSVGSLLSLIDASRQAWATKTVVNNLHFALENMTRDIRTGRNYHCDIAVGRLKEPADCSSSSASSLSFTAFGGETVVYRQNGNAIERSLDGGGEYLPLTSPEVVIEDLRFFVAGAKTAGQPRVFIIAKGKMQGRARVASRFDIETLVSQRLLDI